MEHGCCMYSSVVWCGVVLGAAVHSSLRGADEHHAAANKSRLRPASILSQSIASHAMLTTASISSLLLFFLLPGLLPLSFTTQPAPSIHHLASCHPQRSRRTARCASHTACAVICVCGVQHGQQATASAAAGSLYICYISLLVELVQQW
jgi:hypothetical protein